MLLTLLNPTNANHNSKTIKSRLFSTNKSTTPLQQRHVSKYAVHLGYTGHQAALAVTDLPHCCTILPTCPVPNMQRV